MNYKDIYSKFVEEMFEQHNKDIEATISYINSNQAKIYEWKPDFKEAKRHLTAGEKNDIIWKIITPF
ncbi:hypothetical protein NV391_02440 [Companilactobacillus crustorum]|uniref:hypothetical protein n=1 Tax=Companilactobacillus crustorum TaxID=392416 RepID=UPI00237DECEF|nr:hypothetical protein [Companilactobacillus crustorum]WDT66083.1 hypothetical protein NV391_02440 [Companilactobacillus crustorum]